MPVSSFPATAAPLVELAQNGTPLQMLNVRATEVELEPWPMPTMATEGCELDREVERAGRVLWRSDDRHAVLLLERLGPCRLTGTHGGELLCFYEGRVRAEPPGGEPYVMGPGFISWFAPGMDDVWTIEETYLKLLYVEADRPLPY
jgi:uncharacterized cupin superfamily protein